MGLFETIFGLPEVKGYDFQGMAAMRLGQGQEPIDWKIILLNQLRAEAQLRPLTKCEQFLFESLSK